MFLVRRPDVFGKTTRCFEMILVFGGRVFLRFKIVGVTLVTAKKQHRCLEGARVCVRVREKEPSHSRHFVQKIRIVCYVGFSLCVYQKGKSAFFR